VHVSSASPSYASGMSIPRNPSSPSLRTMPWSYASARSHASECGRISAFAKSRAVRWISRCSSV